MSAEAPTITFTVSNQTYGVTPFAVSANSNSSGTITYSVVSGPATTSGSSVTITGLGTVVLQASQAANGDYTAGTQDASFSVSAEAPTITFTVSNQTYGASPFAVSATSNSSGTITYSVVSGPATVSGATVTITGAGTVVLQASQAASGDYTAGTQNASFTVAKATPTITWATPTGITYGTALSSTQLDATSSVAGTFGYTPAAGTVLTAGSQPLSVSFTPTDTADYSTAAANVTMTVSQATPSIT